MQDNNIENNSLENDFLNDMAETGRVVLALGIKAGGKTFSAMSFLKWALFYNVYERLHLVIPMFSHEQNNSYDFLKNQKHCFIYNGYSENVSKIVDKDRLKYKTLFLIDDASSELIKNMDPVFIKLISTSRHGQGVTVYACVHSAKKILAPLVRQNIDWLFIYRLANKKLLIDIYDEWLSLYFDSFNDFKIYYDNTMKQKYNGILTTIHFEKVDCNIKNWNINLKRDDYELKPTKAIVTKNKKTETPKKRISTINKIRFTH